jgi:hypothetical protein
MRDNRLTEVCGALVSEVLILQPCERLLGEMSGGGLMCVTANLELVALQVATGSG